MSVSEPWRRALRRLTSAAFCSMQPFAAFVISVLGISVGNYGVKGLERLVLKSLIVVFLLLSDDLFKVGASLGVSWGES